MQRKRRLPRRGSAGSGELNLEAVAEERVDAVTVEPLTVGHFVEVKSPDNSLRLFYNNSTLIRIAMDRGGFMQPPHFREPMSHALQKKIEQMEGKRFRFDHRTDFVTLQDGEAGGEDGGGAGEASGYHVLHRHVYFEQIMDEFYLLNPAEVYVCPVCYQHYIATRYIPYLEQQGRRVEYVNNGETPVLDPLDVLTHMQSGQSRQSAAEQSDADEVDSGARAESGREGEDAEGDATEAWDSVMVHIVFRRAHQWKRHMSLHHGVGSIASNDYRLRDVLCSFHNAYNQLSDARFEKDVLRFGDAKRRVALTQQRYWQLNARYNRLRYNRVVEATERAEGHAATVDVSAFENENIAHSFNPAVDDVDDSNFIVADDEVSEESDREFVPHYAASSDDSSPSPSSSSDSPRRRTCRGQKRRRAASRAVGGGNIGRSRGPHAQRKHHSATTPDDDDDDATSSVMEMASEVSEEDGSVVSDDSLSRRKSWYRQGVLAPTSSSYYQRLSAEDRRFVEANARKVVARSQLYDPVATPVRGATSTIAPDTDWGNIGEPLTARSPDMASVTRTKPSLSMRSPALLLDTDGHDGGNDAGRDQQPHRAATTSPKLARLQASGQGRLLLDDE